MPRPDWAATTTVAVTDGSALDAAFGPLQITPLGQAVHDTVAWYQATAKGE